jgi:predicted nucleic acid-binding protein
MTPKKIYWDSCVFIALLSKHKEIEWLKQQEVCKSCMQQAINGDVEIYISTMTIVEVNKTTESTNPIPKSIQETITKLMGQPFIKVIPADLARAFEAREHVWGISWLKPVDAMHLACALYAKVDEVFTYDGLGSQKGLLDLNDLVGTPRLKIKRPHFDGIQTTLPST